MADNLTLNAGSGGSDLATDDVGGIHYQITKLAFGALDAAVLAVAGAGAVGTGTQRVTLGSDDPAVVDLAAIEVLLTTLNGLVDGLEALLGTIDTDTGNIATAAQLLDDTVYVDDADWTDDTSKHLLVGGVYQGTPHTVTDGDVTPFLTDANGRLGVAVGSIAAGDNNIGNVDVASSALPTGASTSAKQDTQITAEQAIQAAVEGTLTVSGTVDLGATDNAVLDDIAAKLATIDADTGTLAAAVSTEVQVDVVGALPAGDNNIGNVDIASALPAGTNAIGKLAANSGVDIGDVDVTSISAGTNAIGNVGLIGRTTGGMSIFNSIDLDETEEDIKTSAGQVFSISAFNHTAAPLYLRFYNATAANTTVGSTAALAGPFTIPGNADSDGAGFIWNNPIGIAFGTAICAAVTTGIAATDTGAPAGNACSVVVGYV